MLYDVYRYSCDGDDMSLIGSEIGQFENDIQSLIAAVIDYYDVHSVDDIFSIIATNNFKVILHSGIRCDFDTRWSNALSLEVAWRGVITDFLRDNPDYVSNTASPIQEDELFALLNC